MATVRCPQCGTEFEREQAQFCPNPKCGYPVAFIEEPTPGPEEKVMVRRPGERVEHDAPVVEEQRTEVMPPVLPPPAHLPLEPSPHIYGAEETPSAPTGRRLRWWILPAAVGGLAIVVAVLIFATRGSPTPPATTVAPTGSSVVVTTTDAPVEATQGSVPQGGSGDWTRDNGWTVIVASMPGTDDGRVEATTWADGLVARGLPGGVLYSSDFRSLRPGYWVAFSGEFDTPDQAKAHAQVLLEAGYDCYVREVSR